VYGLFSLNSVITDWQPTGVVSEEQDQKLSIALVQQPQLADLIIDSQGNRYLVGNNIVDWSFNNDHIGWHITLSQQGTSSMVYQVPLVKPNAVISNGSSYSNDVSLELDLPTTIFLETDY
jgi:hypothetical protein